MREDPKDLPKENGSYWVKYSNGSYGMSTFVTGSKYHEYIWSCLTAWCELPKFEEISE